MSEKPLSGLYLLQYGNEDGTWGPAFLSALWFDRWPPRGGRSYRFLRATGMSSEEVVAVSWQVWKLELEKDAVDKARLRLQQQGSPIHRAIVHPAEESLRRS